MYELAMTKIFLQGRTEAICTVSADCVEFVRTVWADMSGEKKVQALRRAC
jgi:carnitine O-acetyltransferase